MRIPRMISTRHKKVKVYRPPQGAYVQGHWVVDDSNYTEIIVSANIQPLAQYGKKKQMLAEGDRSKNAIICFCARTLVDVQQGTSLQKGDIILWDCVYWEVKQTFTYQMGILDHTESAAIQLEPEDLPLVLT